MFTFSSNHASASFDFRDIANVSIFFDLEDVFATSGGHKATLTRGSEFQRGFPISVL